MTFCSSSNVKSILTMPHHRSCFVAVACVILFCIPGKGDHAYKLYVRPTGSLANITCLPVSPHDCYTLNEWIESSISPFISSSYIVLLPGVHLITSRNGRILTKNVTSLIIYGQPWPGETMISCVHEMFFVFNNVTDLEIHDIKFNSCAIYSEIDPEHPERDTMFIILSFALAWNIAIKGVTIVNGGVLIDRRSTNSSVVVIHNSVIVSSERGFYYSGVHDVNCSDRIPLEELYIFNTSASIRIVRTSCTKVDLHGVVIEQFSNAKIALQVAYALWIVLVDVEFRNNHAPLVYLDAVYIELRGQIVFVSNTNVHGNGVDIRCGHLNIYPRSRIEFSYNYFKGDALALIDCDFTIGTGHNDVTTTQVTMTFSNNAIESGGVLKILDYPSAESIIKSSIVNSDISFHNNTCAGFSKRGDGAIMLLKDIRVQLNNSRLIFNHNQSPLSGGITMMKSSLDVRNMSASFENNHGSDGGGMALYQHSLIFFFDYSILTFHCNSADRKGGVIYIEDYDYINVHTKISEGFRALLIVNDVIVDFEFSKNQAVIAGSEVYGEWIDILDQGRLFTFSENKNDLSVVASNPTRLCMCVASIPDCSVSSYPLSLFPGETFVIEAVAVGQRMGVVPSIVTAELKDGGRFGKGQDVQNVGKECTPLQFKILTSTNLAEMTLKAQDTGVPILVGILQRTLPSRYHVLFQQFSIIAAMRSCPIGFELGAELECSCSPTILAHERITCDFSTYSITRAQGIWMLAEPRVNSSEHYIIIHEHCPYDYCRDDNDSLHIHLENPDGQCAFNRTGILCGACQANFSLTLGSSQCKQCPHTRLFLIIIPGVIAAGIALVILLMLLDLTVSKGVFNGIIFYANIIQIHRDIFFPPNISNIFLKIFIAWLNLDLGIETCFYNGFDSYAKTWFQFAFPFYIWIMVISIIVASHYSALISRIFGNNAVQVLATLFLLSYAKILRVIVTVISYTSINYSAGYTEKVWLLDGNIDFLRGKHIPLFIASLMILIPFVFLYILPLLSIQWLQRISHYRLLFWVRRLMPLFDAYTGPYKYKHRYWTGLLLLIRIIFLITFSLNVSNNPAVNLLTITVISITLLVYLSYMKVYRNWVHTCLEMSSLFNLEFLSLVTLYQLFTGGTGNLLVSTNLSTSFTFITLSIIVSFQAFKRLFQIKRVKWAITNLTSKFERNRKTNQSDNEDQNKLKLKTLTHTSIDLNELLID